MQRWAIPIVALAIGCSGSGEDGGMMRAPDASTEDPDAGVVIGTIEFEIETIDGVGVGKPTVGDNATLALSAGGAPTIAYVAAPVGSNKYEIWYAVRMGNGQWTPERVVVPGAQVAGATGQPIGLGLAHVGNIPHVVYIGGDDDGVVLSPYPTDLMLARKTGVDWSEQTLVDVSNEAPCECPGTQDTCNFGNVVGSHAAIAANAGGGFAVVYRDTHGGFARDDLARSDVELYIGGAGTTNSCVDPVRSGGAFAGITYAMNGSLVVAYNLESQAGPEPRTGIWAAAQNGATWTLTRVSPSLALSKIALATAPDGTIYLAFSHANDVDLVVVTSADNGATWSEPAIVDSSGFTGLHPGIAFDGQGRPVIAYGYCGRQSDGNCPGELGARSVVRLARLEGNAWKIYLVDDGQGFGHVGFFNSVVVTPDGKLGVAFVDDMNGDLLYAREK